MLPFCLRRHLLRQPLADVRERVFPRRKARQREWKAQQERKVEQQERKVEQQERKVQQQRRLRLAEKLRRKPGLLRILRKGRRSCGR